MKRKTTKRESEINLPLQESQVMHSTAAARCPAHSVLQTLAFTERKSLALAIASFAYVLLNFSQFV